MSESSLKKLLENNAAWAARIKRDDPEFFEKLGRQQAPEYLWIGCSDSRVPANQIMGLLPGEVFVHRNIANLVQHSDLNCLSVLQFAVEVIKIRHIIVCGHYGCSGIDAAVHGRKVGLADNWLRSAQDVFSRKKTVMEKMTDRERWDYACEQNVVEQVRSVALTTVLQDAWERGQDVSIHGWVYGIHDGLVRELITDVNSNAALAEKYAAAT